MSIDKFLGDLKDRPEVISKRLNDEEKENTIKIITEEELKIALDIVNSGKKNRSIEIRMRLQNLFEPIVCPYVIKHHDSNFIGYSFLLICCIYVGR